MAVIILLLVTAAIVYGVIKGFEFFESKHGDDPAPREEVQDGPQAVPGTDQPNGGGVR